MLDARFHYYRDDARRPLITLCRLEDTDRGQIAYGWALCSPGDNASKWLGRDIAEQRATWALGKAGILSAEYPNVRLWGRRVKRKEAMDTVTKSCNAFGFLHLIQLQETKYLPRYMQPELAQQQEQTNGN